MTEDGRTVAATEETKEEATRLETKEVEGESVGDESSSGGGGGVCYNSSGVIGDDSGTINEHGDCSSGEKNNNSANSGVGVSGGSGSGGGGGLSCRGGTLRLLRGLVEGPIGRVAARVHRWGTTGGVNPSAPSERECPGGEGTPRRNVLDATKNRRLMGANLTKQSRVSRSRGGGRVGFFWLPTTRVLHPSSPSFFFLSSLFFSSSFLSFFFFLLLFVLTA